MHLAPIAELLDEDADEDFAPTYARAAGEVRGLPLRQKREKVASLDMRFQRYRKAEP